MRFSARFRATWLRSCAVGAVIVAACAAAAVARAEPGVSDNTIVIGRSAGLTGSLAERMKPATQAIEAYFGAVNAAGGIHGRRLRLINVDDGNDPARAAENTRRLVDEERVFVMFANSGTPQTVAAMKVLAERGVPLVGTTSGADSVQAFNPLLFHYKASYGQELRRIAEHLKTINITRVALVYSPDPTGEEGRALAMQGHRVGRPRCRPPVSAPVSAPGVRKPPATSRWRAHPSTRTAAPPATDPETDHSLELRPYQ